MRAWFIKVGRAARLAAVCAGRFWAASRRLSVARSRSVAGVTVAGSMIEALWVMVWIQRLTVLERGQGVWNARPLQPIDPAATPAPRASGKRPLAPALGSASPRPKRKG